MICAMFPKSETNKKTKQVTCFIFICFIFWKHSTDHFTLYFTSMRLKPTVSGRLHWTVCTAVEVVRSCVQYASHG